MVKGGNLVGIPVREMRGYLLGSVMFTCDVFFDFVPAFCGKPPVAHQVADQWQPRAADSD